MLKALLFTVQKALPLFQDGGGSIILTASAGGSKGIEGYSVYHATKAAIRSFARTWTVESETPQDPCQRHQSWSDTHITHRYPGTERGTGRAVEGERHGHHTAR